MTKQRVIDLLAMSRFANLPTVWSNVFSAFVLAWILSSCQSPLFGFPLFGVCFMVSCLYLGGCFLNDWHDSEFDRQTRPDRPIPSGRWHRHHILILACSLMFAGSAGMFLFSIKGGFFSILIVVSILLYTKWHKTKPFSLLFMAGARLLVYPTAYFAITPELHASPQKEWLYLIAAALPMGIYILGISLTARNESKPPSERSRFDLLGYLCLIAPLLWTSYLALWLGFALTEYAIPIALLLVIQIIICKNILQNHDIGRFVSASLASIPLIDFLFVGSLSFFFLSCGSQNFSGALLFTQPLLSFLALQLQKIAPAT